MGQNIYYKTLAEKIHMTNVQTDWHLKEGMLSDLGLPPLAQMTPAQHNTLATALTQRIAALETKLYGAGGKAAWDAKRRADNERNG